MQRLAYFYSREQILVEFWVPNMTFSEDKVDVLPLFKMTFKNTHPDRFCVKKYQGKPK